MSKFKNTFYTFTPGISGVGTINLAGINNFNVAYLLALINQTRGVIIYSTGSTTLGYTNLSSKTLTLTFDTSTHSANDIIQIAYEDQDEKNVMKSAFGEAMIVEPTPVFQADFRSNIVRTRLWDTNVVNGSVTALNGMAVLQTSAAANSYAKMQSKIPVKYNAGQGGEGRFTALFSTPAAGSVQLIGLGDFQDGLFVGYINTTFGTVRRAPQNNRRAITSITRASTTVTVTTTASHLLTTGDIVQITGTSSTPVAQNNYIGSFVITVTGVNTFTYICVDSPTSPATGSYLYDLIVDNFTAITAFTDDRLDGGGPSKQIYVPTYGNVFNINFQYLGFGHIKYEMEEKETGAFFVFDSIDYANANTIPTLQNPTLPLYACVRNIANTTNLVLKTASMAGFVQGKNTELGLDPFSASALKTGITTQAAVISIQNKRAFNGEINKTRSKILTINLYAEGSGTNPVTVKVIRGTTLGGSPSYTDVDTNNSTHAYDTAGTTITGGEVLKTYTIARNSPGLTEHELDLNIFINPEEIITVSVTTATSVDATCSINWKELV